LWRVRRGCPAGSLPTIDHPSFFTAGYGSHTRFSLMTSSQDAPLSERQSLDIIQAMIRQAQGRFSDDGSHYLLWGWLVLGASLIHLALLQTPYASYAPTAWLAMLVGGIRTSQLGRRHAESEIRTYSDRLLGVIWGAVGAGLGLTFCLFFTHVAQIRLMYPIVLMLYGIGLFVSGGILRFKPLTWGGAWCWGLSFTIAWLPFEGQLIGLAAGAAGGYLIPGYMMRARFRAENTLSQVTTADASRSI
jgi:hypothetical protein